MNEPFRQRFLAALATLTVAGGLVWWGVHPATRLCGLAMLAAAGSLLAHRRIP